MDASMKIEEFNTRLTATGDESPLLAALRQLTQIAKPGEVVEVVSEGLSWGWG